VLALDRPGVGRSTFQARRRIVDWPRDVAAFADALRIERFAVAGWSAGGPYALACAALLPGRVAAAATIGSPCPLDWPGAGSGLLNAGDRRLTAIAQRSPGAARAILAVVARLARSFPKRARASFEASLAPVDVAALAGCPELARLGFFLAAFAGGARGVAWDYRLAGAAWGFDLGSAGCPVEIWHGRDDRVVSPGHAEALARAIPESRLRLLDDAGHLLFVGRERELLRALV
jgi:pimeloyl-ACP methyl ester carboxylesterase